MSLNFKNQGSDTNNSIRVTSKKNKLVKKSNQLTINNVATLYIIRDPPKKTYCFCGFSFFLPLLLVIRLSFQYLTYMQIKAEDSLTMESYKSCLSDLVHHALEVRNIKDSLGLL